MSQTSHAPFWLGTKDTLPLIFAAMPFGIVYGAMAAAQGLPGWVIMAISLCVFAGASQFITVTLLAAGAPLPVIVFTVFIVNLRHMLYAISLIPFIQKIGQIRRLPMAFTLTDETFAVAYNYATEDEKQATNHNAFSKFYLSSGIVMYVNWALCSWIGMVTGDRFPQLTSFGLDIAMVVAFIGIVVPHLKLPSHWLCALVAGVSGALTYHWPNQSGLLVSALLAIVVGVVSENLTSKQNNRKTAEQV